METRKFELTKHGKPTGVTITIEAPAVTGAEQNLVILDKDSAPLAILQLQPSVDRREER